MFFLSGHTDECPYRMLKVKVDTGAQGNVLPLGTQTNDPIECLKSRWTLEHKEMFFLSGHTDECPYRLLKVKVDTGAQGNVLPLGTQTNVPIEC